MKATITLEDGRRVDLKITRKQLEAFEEMQDKMPMDWKDLDDFKGWYINSNSEAVELGCNFVGVLKPSYSCKNTFPKKHQAESAAIFLPMLLQLRKHYRDGWKPKDGEDVWGVSFRNGVLKVQLCEVGWVESLFSFQSRAVTERFVKDQEDLLYGFFNLYK
jgi:hypothetical protein